MTKNSTRVDVYAWMYMFSTIFLCNGQFLGGTISWMVVPGNKVRFQYRITWKYGTGPCSQHLNISTIGTECSNFTPEVAKLSWIVHEGNHSSRLGDVRYIATSYSKIGILGWEQGEHMLYYKPKGNQFTVSLSGIPWQLSGADTSSAYGHMETSVDTRTRNDTRKPNASPYCALPPFLGVPLDCSSTMLLPFEDPEGETTRCRLAEPPECGTGCSNVPKNTVQIDQKSCSLTIHAFQSMGYRAGALYRVAIVIEDLTSDTRTLVSTVITKKQPLSRVPLQFTIRVSSDTVSCNTTDLRFVLPTPTDRARPSYGIMDYLRHKTVELSFYLETSNINTSTFQLSGPMFLRYDYLTDDLSLALNRTNVTRMYLRWQPNITSPWQQISYQQVCVWGLSKHGISSQPQCITDIVTDTGDFCKTKVRCQNNGTCLNLFKDPNEKCICPVGFKGKDCSKVIECSDDPCDNNGTCIPLSSGRYQCNCAKDFTGSNCEYEINSCLSHPCLNGGTCINGYHLTYTCICRNNYTGTVCARKSNQSGSTLIDTRDWWWLLILIGCCLLVLMSTAICCSLGKYLDKDKPQPETPEQWAIPRRNNLPIG